MAYGPRTHELHYAVGNTALKGRVVATRRNLGPSDGEHDRGRSVDGDPPGPGAAVRQ